jgi:succinoglycan biosynthesis transport protein ExoP
VIDKSSTGPTSLADYAAIVWRRRFIVLAAVVGVPLVAIALTSLQDAEYRASADVLLRDQNLISSITGIPDTTQDPQRLLDTQARLARVPSIANAAVKNARDSMSGAELLSVSSVSADPSADILTFSVNAPLPDQAIRLANAYASAYTRYRTELDRGPVDQALASVQARIEKLQAAHAVNSAFYSSLVAKQQQLQSILALPSQSAKVVEAAVSAPKVKPRPMLAAALGAIVGILLGIAAALILEAVEKRPRSIEELQSRLGLRILGRIPSTAEGRSGLVTLSHPGSIDAEVYRLLRQNFEHAASEAEGRVFVVTSAVEGEGKSTVAANLAISLARAGRSVILVDADPLRPVLRERFRLGRRPGLIEVATSHASLADALADFPLPTMSETGPGWPGGNARVYRVPEQRGEVRGIGEVARKPGEMDAEGSLRVLIANPAPIEVTDHVVATKLEGVIAQLRREAELVILDGAPLTTSVGMGVGRLSDGVVLVVNLTLVRRPMLELLSQTLEEIDATKLGLVLTGLSIDATFTYGYYSSAMLESIVPEAPAAAEKIEGRWSSAS